MGKLSDLKKAVAVHLATLPVLADIEVIPWDTSTGTKIGIALQKAAGLAVIVAMSAGEIEASKADLPNPALNSTLSVTIWANPTLIQYSETQPDVAPSEPLDQTSRDPDDILEACLSALHNHALQVDHAGGEACSNHQLKVLNWAILDTDTNFHVYEITCNTTLYL